MNTMMDKFEYKDAYKTSSGLRDKRAIAYGYFDILPDKVDNVCRDINLIEIERLSGRRGNRSPECSRNDATSTPLQNFVQELKEVLYLLTHSKDDSSLPHLSWDAAVMNRVSSLTFNILAYHFSAEKHYDQLQTVLIDGRSPENPQEVKDLVIDLLNPLMCFPDIPDLLSNHLELTNSSGEWTREQVIQENKFRFYTYIHSQIFQLTDVRTLCSF